MAVSATLADDTTTERAAEETQDYARVRLTRDGSTESALTVHYSVNEQEVITVDTDKTTGEYYMPATFEIGQATIFLDINAIDDQDLEPDDGWTFELLDDPVSGDGDTYTVDPQHRTVSGTIKDNDVKFVLSGTPGQHTTGEAPSLTIKSLDYNDNPVPNVRFAVLSSEVAFPMGDLADGWAITDSSGQYTDADWWGATVGTGRITLRGHQQESVYSTAFGPETTVELGAWNRPLIEWMREDLTAPLGGFSEFTGTVQRYNGGAMDWYVGPIGYSVSDSSNNVDAQVTDWQGSTVKVALYGFNEPASDLEISVNVQLTQATTVAASPTLVQVQYPDLSWVGSPAGTWTTGVTTQILATMKATVQGDVPVQGLRVYSYANSPDAWDRTKNPPNPTGTIGVQTSEGFGNFAKITDSSGQIIWDLRIQGERVDQVGHVEHAYWLFYTHGRWDENSPYTPVHEGPGDSLTHEVVWQ